MRATVSLTLEGTTSTERTYSFTKPTSVVAGRAEDCDLPTMAHDKRVSRHHCLFDIDPPDVRVSDLGSLNGTYVNGARIEEYRLIDGDEVHLGSTVVRVSTTAAG